MSKVEQFPVCDWDKRPRYFTEATVTERRDTPQRYMHSLYLPAGEGHQFAGFVVSDRHGVKQATRFPTVCTADQFIRLLQTAAARTQAVLGLEVRS